jgi:hypothetical protein
MNQMIESEYANLRQALHDLNNSLNTIAMQTELARVYAGSGETELLQKALAVITNSCGQCRSISHRMQSTLPAREN